MLADARAILGTDVFEIASLPPCVPGMRMNNRLVKLAKDERVDYMLGTKVVGATAGSDGKLESITLHTTGHERELKADAFVLERASFGPEMPAPCPTGTERALPEAEPVFLIEI